MNKWLKDEYLEIPEDVALKLTPGGDFIHHQYGGLGCLQFEGNYSVERVDGVLETALATFNARICDSGFGDEITKGLRKDIEKLLGQKILKESAEGLIALEDGTYIAMENCD